MKRAMNTYLLALDGDVDFHPPAVQLLVDRMRKNPLVGAACGRIHPVGNGKHLFYLTTISWKPLFVMWGRGLRE